MKYFYSMLIVLVAFFGIPPVLDYSGHLADYFRQMSKEEDTDSSSFQEKQKARDTEPRTDKSITTPTAMKTKRE